MSVQKLKTKMKLKRKYKKKALKQGPSKKFVKNFDLVLNKRLDHKYVSTQGTSTTFTEVVNNAWSAYQFPVIGQGSSENQRIGNVINLKYAEFNVPIFQDNQVIPDIQTDGIHKEGLRAIMVQLRKGYSVTEAEALLSQTSISSIITKTMLEGFVVIDDRVIYFEPKVMVQQNYSATPASTVTYVDSMPKMLSYKMKPVIAHLTWDNASTGSVVPDVKGQFVLFLRMFSIDSSGETSAQTFAQTTPNTYCIYTDLI